MEEFSILLLILNIFKNNTSVKNAMKTQYFTSNPDRLNWN